jgi:hypothetical protein
MQHNLGVGEEASTPTPKLVGGATKLVNKNMAGFNVVSGLIPSTLDNIAETRNAGPEVLELEATRPTRPTIVRQKERAVVGKRG